MHWKLFIVGVLLGSLAFHTLVTNAEQPDSMPVAFLTQLDGSAFAGTDCGPASVAMAINYATGEHLKPLEVRQAIIKLPGGGYAANPSSGTALGDLARVARAHNVEVFAGDGASSTGWGPERIRKHLAQGHPVIVLARLALLPGYAPTSQFDHYILLTGASSTGYVYNDPGRSAGARVTISEQQLQAALRASSVPGQGAAFGGPAGRAGSGSGSGAVSAAGATALATFAVTVSKGDTLSQIAERYGLPMKEIVALNRVPNVDRIQVGQVLVLPGVAEPAASGGTTPSGTPTAAPSATQTAAPKGTPNLAPSATPAASTSTPPSGTPTPQRGTPTTQPSAPTGATAGATASPTTGATAKAASTISPTVQPSQHQAPQRQAN